jgi:hypothetical protein
MVLDPAQLGVWRGKHDDIGRCSDFETRRIRIEREDRGREKSEQFACNGSDESCRSVIWPDRPLVYVDATTVDDSVVVPLRASSADRQRTLGFDRTKSKRPIGELHVHPGIR